MAVINHSYNPLLKRQGGAVCATACGSATDSQLVIQIANCTVTDIDCLCNGVAQVSSGCRDCLYEQVTDLEEFCEDGLSPTGCTGVNCGETGGDSGSDGSGSSAGDAGANTPSSAPGSSGPASTTSAGSGSSAGGSLGSPSPTGAAPGGGAGSGSVLTLDAARAVTVGMIVVVVGGIYLA
ncbi:hypothetical protein CALCODRAFT_493029 [Calocera cornea HHB12733]|uniref:Uncharacterized protein n=1 Tax=Calocera cornea HHB12733 TaxID=1353952 RepID=A0A165I221_9BASI|nr:hypothetical protein CALCODRAFT_493029 [Calocera cornea HHB12733]